MKLSHLIASTATDAVIATGVATPHANAWENDYNAATNTCTITFSDQDQSNVNNAYRELFELMAKNSFAALSNPKDAKLVQEYALDPATKNAALLSGDGKVSSAQTKYFFNTMTLGVKDHPDYIRAIAFANLSKKPVITEQTLTMTPEEAHEDGGVMYGVDLAGVIAASAWTGVTEGSFVGVRDLILETAKENYPRFGGPILTYSQAFEACANKEDANGSTVAGSNLTGDQFSSIGIAGGVIGLILIAIMGFAARPFVDQFVANLGF
ncbi:hypothetical protein G7Y29_09595 [Corynebacterium qintianiae]|uniref:Uncharacterized protein n=1 Tax=Corynebacterium qintianiae TaxID=2709392 RepID=A0A7T0KMK3_9CORY|nr:hypothetical protein [Corynebacterium qintianiae]QPK83079.1 hypothetical protein G7Y29_09595 [Corynebacterium qintianiae]